jgi:hypothetical protein
MTDHPITPPPEMVNEWVRMLEFLPDKQVFSEVAQWGADQELEACCEWLKSVGLHTYALHTARRPKPPSLKEQALADLTEVCEQGKLHPESLLINTIRKALEALPND